MSVCRLIIGVTTKKEYYTRPMVIIKSKAKTFRGHYPLYAHQNSVLMVDTWMCSALPQELEIIGDPIVVRSNALLIKKGGLL